MKHLFVWLFAIFLAIVEGSVWALPVLIAFLLPFIVIKKEPWVFPIAFVAGLLLDTLTLGVVGLRSLFFILLLFVVLLYERKFEVQTIPFVFFSSFLGSLLYLYLFGYDLVFPQAVVGSIVAVMFFLLCYRFKTAKLTREV